MLKIRGFRGAIPKLDPTLLPDGFAQVCRNARMRSGALIPFRNPVTVHTLGANASSFVKLGNTWRGYPNTQTHVVPGPVDNTRFYISRNGTPPRMESLTAPFDYALAMPQPTNVPTVAVVGGTVDPDNKETIVFAHTLVSSLGEESRPSPLSALIDWSPGVTITMGNFGGVPSGRGITKRRIYRSVFNLAGQIDLYFVREIDATDTFTLYNQQFIPAEPIPSMDYDPPVAGLRGFTAMPNGIVAGFAGRTLYFCEPFILHAWPIKYSLSVEHQIVGLAAFGSSLAVMTEGTPYIVQGSHPESMVMSRIEENAPCASPRSIVDLGYAAAYASHDGLVSISASGVSMITRGLFTREEWTKLNPSGIRASSYEGRYIYRSVNVQDPFSSFGIIDLTGETPEYIELKDNDLDETTWFYDVETSKLYGLSADQRAIREFDAPSGAPMTFRWRSKRFQTGALMNFPWARTDARVAAGQSVTSTLLGGPGASTIHSWTDTNEPVRLPSGRLDDSFSIEIAGTGEVFGVGIGRDPVEVGN